MDINTLTSSYFSDIILSVIIITGAIILSKLLSVHLRKKTSRKTRTRLVLFLMFILVISILLELWKDKNEVINQIATYKHFLPGYDTIIMIIAAVVFSHLLQIWLLRNSDKLNNDLSKRHKIRLMARWISWGVFFITTVLIMLIERGWENIATFLGLIGAGFALSMQETILCLIGWIYIIFNHAYDIGDRIELNGKLGDVISITPTHTRMLEIATNIQGGQSTGRILIIPNSQIFRNPVVNSTIGFPFIWLEIAVTVTFESNVERAISVISDIAGNTAQKIEPEVMKDITAMQDEYAIHYRYLTPAVYSRILSNGVELTLRFLSPVRSCRQNEHNINLKILQAIAHAQDIDLAYPTSRLYRRFEEQEYNFSENKK